MSQTSSTPPARGAAATKAPAEQVVRDIRRAARKQYSAEEIRIVPEGLRGEASIAGLCRREGAAESLNRLPDEVRGRIIGLALAEPELSPRELAVRFTDRERTFVSGVSVCRLLEAHALITSPAFMVKAADEFHTKTMAPNQLWQAGFTYLKVTGWSWFYLSTGLDDVSRRVIAWKLCTTMAAGDVTDTLELALAASGCTQARVRHRPRLLSDNGLGYIAGAPADWLASQQMEHTRGAPCHPQTQGKIERWYQTLKNRILLAKRSVPGELETKVGAFVEHYNHPRAHESLGNLTPADVYLSRGQAILSERARIKRQTIQQRRLRHQSKPAQPRNTCKPDPPLDAVEQF